MRATYSVFLLFIVVTWNPILDIHASKINALDVPPVIRNGTGPIDLSCVYNVSENENGLVIKWYRDMDQIYQWIPPMPPQDAGIINGFAEYPEGNLKYPNSKSIIHLKAAVVEMSGEYACMVSTFQEEDLKKTMMVIYEPETNATIHVSSFNDSHLNVTCVVDGARPPPILKLFLEGIEIDSYYGETESMDRHRTYSVKRTAIIGNTLEPMLLDCEVSIPYTDYKRRERIVYYPVQSLAQTSNAMKELGIVFSNYTIILILSCVILISNSRTI